MSSFSPEKAKYNVKTSVYFTYTFSCFVCYLSDRMYNINLVMLYISADDMQAPIIKNKLFASNILCQTNNQF